MSVASKWNTREYQRIASASHQGDGLVVRFEDGASVSLDSRRVLPAESGRVDWDGMSVNPYELVIPTAGGQIEVSWSTIRVLTDREYAAHLAAAAEAQASQIGLRIKQLREARGLSSKELAERAGITPQSLSRIEHGRHDVVFTTLRRIVAAMGCSLRDLAEFSARTGFFRRSAVSGARRSDRANQRPICWSASGTGGSGRCHSQAARSRNPGNTAE